MNAKQMISLLLAGQMLSAPMAQPASLSRLEAAQREAAGKAVQVEKAATSVSKTIGMPPMRMNRITGKTYSSAQITAYEAGNTTTSEAGEETTSTPDPEATSIPDTEATTTPAPEARFTPDPESTTTPDLEATSTSDPEATSTLDPESTTTPDPEVTSTPEPESTTTPDPEVTSTPEPESTTSPDPEATTTPEPETSETTPPATGEEETTPTPNPEVSPLPLPGEDVVLPPEADLPPAVETAPVPLAADVMPLEAEEYYYNYAHIGFGYEIYNVDIPNEDGSPKYAKLYYRGNPAVGFDTGTPTYPELAAEKPPAGDEDDQEREFHAYAAGFIYGNDGMTDSWLPDENNHYSVAGDQFTVNWQDFDGEDFDWELWGPYYNNMPSLEVMAKWVGRIPDYEFSGWFLSGWVPSRANEDYDDPRYVIGKYPTEYNTGYKETITRIPLAYAPGDRDYQLTDAEGRHLATIEDISEIEERIVDSGDDLKDLVDELQKENSLAFLGYYYNDITRAGQNSGRWDDIADLPIIAHWKLSSNATIVDEAKINAWTEEEKGTEFTGLYVTSVDDEAEPINLLANSDYKLYTAPFSDPNSTTTTFDGKKSGVYYLRVNSNIAAIDPLLLTYEAFRTEERDTIGSVREPGLTIEVRQAGSTEKKTYTLDTLESLGTKVKKDILNDSDSKDHVLYNNYDYPMRAKWTLVDEENDPVSIPLALSQSVDGAVDEKIGYYNEITVTVTPPDGGKPNVYVFYIQRLSDPRVEQNPGNTPMGMIARSPEDKNDEISSEEAMESLKAKKTDGENGNKTYHALNSGLLPGGEENNQKNYDIVTKNGAPRRYYANAWGNSGSEGFYNVDLDPTAIVVYQDSSFVDPGFTIYDSQGDPVSFDSGNIKRSIVLRVVDDNLTVDDITDTAGDELYYSPQGGKMEAMPGERTETYEVITDADGKSVIDLRGVRVVPGVYSIEYELTDPLSGWIYNSGSEEHFIADKANAATFSRTLVILPMPGDVDMDGAVTTADAQLLAQAIEQAASGSGFLASTNGSIAELYKYRVCDVNNDGKVDAADVAAIYGNFTPTFSRGQQSNGYYYLPLTTGLTTEDPNRTRGTVDPVDAVQGEKARLSLELLGLNTPDIAAAPGNLDRATWGAEDELSKENNIFWVGVKVSDLDKLTTATNAIRNGISSLTLSISYNSDYLVPALVESDYADSAVGEKDRWIDMLKKYNLSADTSTNNEYLWNKNYEIVPDGTLMAEIYLYTYKDAIHYSRAILPWEFGDDEAFSQRAGRTQQVIVTLRNTIDTGDRVLSGDSYLLRLPFKMINAPMGAEYLEALDVTLGMEDLNLMARMGDNTVVTAAWSSAAGEIFGGATWNLADELCYVDSIARAIPISDEIVGDKLENGYEGSDGITVYGEEFYRRAGFLENQVAPQSDLEEVVKSIGLSYDYSTGTISGIPNRVGKFPFSVSSGTYYIEVVKAPLTLSAVAQSWYYGESVAEFDYIYNVDDIKSPDLPADQNGGVAGANYVTGFTNNGTSTDLAKLAGYNGPVLDSDDVEPGTNVGTYYVTISGGVRSGLDNYYFVYADGTLGPDGKTVMSETTSTDSAKSELKIEKRPILIDHLNDSAMEPVKVYVDTFQTVFENLEASWQKDMEEKDFELVDLGTNAEYGYTDKLSGSSVFGDDKVTITFNAELEHDNGSVPYYNSTGPREAKISNVNLDNPNYTWAMKNGTRVKLLTETANGTVLDNYVVDINVEHAPATGSDHAYSYGDLFSLFLTEVTLIHSRGNEDFVQFSETYGFGTLGIQVTYVTADEKKDGVIHRDEEDYQLHHGDTLVASIHNGMYLCFSAPNGNGGYVKWYSDDPMVVRKKDLRLSIKPVEVYYGDFDSSMLDFTYDPADLTAEDRAAMLEKLGQTELKGTSSELSALTGYKAPKLYAKETSATSADVTADTPVNWQNGRVSSYWIYIENETDDNGVPISGAGDYSFQYYRGALLYDDYGVSDGLTIYPRPIVVEKVVLGRDSKAFLYDNTQSATLRWMYYNGMQTPVTAAGVNDAATTIADRFVASLPATGYRLAYGTETIDLLYGLTGDAIHRNTVTDKLDDVVVKYVATYTDYNSNAVLPESGFNMGDDLEIQTKARITELELTEGEGANSNYVLVFTTQGSANTARPNVAENNDARVKLRALQKVEIVNNPAKMTYTYGQPLDLSGMTLRLEYESEGDNNPARNAAAITLTLPYREIGQTNSFASQGLATYWVMDSDLVLPQTMTQNELQEYIDAKKLIPTTDNSGYPDMAKNGMRLLVCGHRTDKNDTLHPLVWAMTKGPVQVEKKTLPITVEGQNRFYGQQNTTYQASIPFSSLAAPDQTLLRNAGVTGTTLILTAGDTSGFGVFTPVVSKDLDKLSGGTSIELGLKFDTNATQGSPVGRYTIGLIPDGESGLDNYKFDAAYITPATLRVFRRPFVVQQILEKPVSIIYWNTPETIFPASVTQTGQATTEGEGFKAQLPRLTAGAYESSDPDVKNAVSATGMTWAMPLSGDAIYGNDTVELSMNVEFPEVSGRVDIAPGEYQADQSVTIRDMVLTGEGAANYYLIYEGSSAGVADETAGAARSPVNNRATGQLDRRPIKAIEVTNNPKMTGYTYRDTLDLSGLRVKVYYDRKEGDSFQEEEILTYSQLAGRLQVNYWASTTAPTKDQVKTLPWPAASGDHLTIAPSHEDPNHEFAHNGKYLVISVRGEADETVEFAEPVLIRQNLTSGSPVKLEIAPLDLTYSLAAKGREYDGKTATDGSITLTNVYTAVSGGKNDRDLIYVNTGAPYAGDEALAEMLNGKETDTEAYTFNGEATQRSGIKFDFYDANVVYYDETYTEEYTVRPEDWVGYWNSVNHNPKSSGSADWDSYGGVAPMPVLVSGISIQGPDAANYTWDTAVGRMGAVDEYTGSDGKYHRNTDNSGKAYAPYAAINKAEQFIKPSEILPQVQVDTHTNTVKVTYDVNVRTQGNQSDRYASELHYEYNLEYQVEDGPSTETLLGADKGSDLPYFGGEKWDDDIPDEYAPSDSDSSGSSGKEETIIKGQNYPWASEDTGFLKREQPLERDTIYWGMVRLAETHNYYASDYVRAYADSDPEKLEEQKTKALADADAVSDAIREWVQTKPTESDDQALISAPADAAKTYTQAFVIYSTEEKTGADKVKYQLGILEATWFTDIQIFDKKEELNATVRNLNPVRYYTFYWDRDHSAEVKFDDDGNKLDLTQEEKKVEISRKTESGTVKEEITVNEHDSAIFYVTTKPSGGGSTIPDGITITGAGGSAMDGEGGAGGPTFHLGDPPYDLEVTFQPAYVAMEGIRWSSSDPRIVQVDSNGRLTFAGVGTAEITAVTTRSGKKATIVVTVTDPRGLSQGVGAGWRTSLALDQQEGNRFNFYYMDPFFGLDKNYNFYPERVMDRGELSAVLALFYETVSKAQSGAPSFPDMTGEEDYAEAVERLHADGILVGLPDGSFGGEQAATRAEAATILCRMMGLEPLKLKEDDESYFLDVDEESCWAIGYINALAEAGVVLGTGDSYFTPDREITRAELAAMLCRVLLTGVYYDGKEIIPSDVAEEHWAYDLIVRAVNTVVPRTKM